VLIIAHGHEGAGCPTLTYDIWSGRKLSEGTANPTDWRQVGVMEVDYVRLVGWLVHFVVCGGWGVGWLDWAGRRVLDWVGSGESGTGLRMMGIFVLFVVGFCFALLQVCFEHFLEYSTGTH